MSEEVKEEIKSEEAPKPVTHAEMFFRYVAALAQTAGVQSFTIAVAAPKEDGTSQILAMAAGNKDAPKEWQAETARLLGEQATNACAAIYKKEDAEEAITPVEVV